MSPAAQAQEKFQLVELTTVSQTPDSRQAGVKLV
jgi:hypothetical protein